jgi:hypothetical protein
VVVVVVVVVIVELVVALEGEESRKRGITAVRLLEEEVEEGQVEAVFPGSEADTDWLAKSEVRRPDTRTSASTSPWEPRAEVMSQRRPWWTVSVEATRLALMATEAAALRMGTWVMVKVVYGV